MPLHPQAASLLEQIRLADPKRVENCTPIEVRNNMRAGMLRAEQVDDRLSGDAISIHDRQVAISEGVRIGVRMYRGARSGRQRAIVFFHGGGWVAGDIDTHDVLCRGLALTFAGTILSVDYRRAPEHRFPTAVEDAYAITMWALAHADELEIDPGRLAVAGDSAGGNLAAGVSLMARDRGGPMPTHQVLIYPITDAEFERPSYTQFADGYLLTRSAMQWFWQQYATSLDDRNHPYATPLRAQSHVGLPPALVVTAECDVLRDEGEAYADCLHRAGVPTQLHRFDGLIHGFYHRYTMFDAAPRLSQLISDWMR